eukprot:691002-Amphidinium_carterae.1
MQSVLCTTSSKKYVCQNWISKKRTVLTHEGIKQTVNLWGGLLVVSDGGSGSGRFSRRPSPLNSLNQAPAGIDRSTHRT